MSDEAPKGLGPGTAGPVMVWGPHQYRLGFCAKRQPSSLQTAHKSLDWWRDLRIHHPPIPPIPPVLHVRLRKCAKLNSTWLDHTQTGIVILNFPSSLLESSGAVGADAHPQESARSTASSQRACRPRCRRSPLHCRPVASLLTTALRCRPVVVVAAEQQGPAPCEQ